MTTAHDQLRPVWHKTPGPGERIPTEQECIEAAGRVLAISDLACAQMTPREQAEAAWTPTYRGTVTDLEDRIRADRGMAPVDREEVVDPRSPS